MSTFTLTVVMVAIMLVPMAVRVVLELIEANDIAREEYEMKEWEANRANR